MRSLSVAVLTTALLLVQGVFAAPTPGDVNCDRKRFTFKRQDTATSEMIQAQAAAQVAYQAAVGAAAAASVGNWALVDFDAATASNAASQAHAAVAAAQAAADASGTPSDAAAPVVLRRGSLLSQVCPLRLELEMEEAMEAMEEETEEAMEEGTEEETEEEMAGDMAEETAEEMEEEMEEDAAKRNQLLVVSV
ncbi:hypothetical protein C8F01DRAFT_1256302 [Mycena amicta]|nr:hypothetical protein C8F01DRAFT_1256302 [Mycena amicta]